ncbi:MAG: site-2 protease family protein, partial [Oscillospiraceae bacterium]|nr:site-2 protease family protein [Oscillospiraceae bacterium]
MTSFGTIMKNLNWSYLTDILKAVIPALICIVLHELAHGLAAYKLGDETAKRMGRLTLNPLKHIDPLGLICMAVLHFGWAKPVPVNMYNFKNPKRGM